jgi:MarR family transcriptional regulator, organic hydroperoxide resistance regulator
VLIATFHRATPARCGAFAMSNGSLPAKRTSRRRSSADRWSPGNRLATNYLMYQTIRIMLLAMFDTKVGRLLDAYPAIYLACHRRHIRDDETGAVVTAHQASILDHLDLQRLTTLLKLAERLGIGRSAMSIQVNKLVCKGYMRRRPVPGDARKTGLTLTDAGNKVKKQNTVLDPDRVKAIFALMPVSELEPALQGIERFAKFAAMLTKRDARSKAR